MISGREAAIGYAACSNRAYVEQFCEQLVAMNFSAPLVRSAVLTAVAMVGLSGGAPDPGDVNALFQAIPKPLPGYVRHSDPNAFAEVLQIQSEQERKRRLRDMG